MVAVLVPLRASEEHQRGRLFEHAHRRTLTVPAKCAKSRSGSSADELFFDMKGLGWFTGCCPVKNCSCRPACPGRFVCVDAQVPGAHEEYKPGVTQTPVPPRELKLPI